MKLVRPVDERFNLEGVNPIGVHMNLLSREDRTVVANTPEVEVVLWLMLVGLPIGYAVSGGTWLTLPIGIGVLFGAVCIKQWTVLAWRKLRDRNRTPV